MFHISPIPSDHLRVVEKISVPAGVINDDRVGYAGNILWVIDGATDASANKLLPGESDATWLAEKFHRNFLEQAPAFGGELTVLVERTTEKVARDYMAERISDAPDRGYHPSAACLVASIRDGMAEILSLGDCQLFMAQPGAKSQLCGVDRSRLGDRAAIERIRKAAKEQGLNWHAAHAQLHSRSAEFRQMMNKRGGYGVLSLDVPPPELIHREEIPIQPGTRLLLATDGFTRLYEIFGAYTENTLLEAAFERGLASLVAELRRLEDQDPDCTSAARIKKRDDATAILAIAQ
jgi:hypothetical protein